MPLNLAETSPSRVIAPLRAGMMNSNATSAMSPGRILATRILGERRIRQRPVAARAVVEDPARHIQYREQEQPWCALRQV